MLSSILLINIQRTLGILVLVCIGFAIIYVQIVKQQLLKKEIQKLKRKKANELKKQNSITLERENLLANPPNISTIVPIPNGNIGIKFANNKIYQLSAQSFYDNGLTSTILSNYEIKNLIFDDSSVTFNNRPKIKKKDLLILCLNSSPESNLNPGISLGYRRNDSKHKYHSNNYYHLTLYPLTKIIKYYEYWGQAHGEHEVGKEWQLASILEKKEEFEKYHLPLTYEPIR